MRKLRIVVVIAAGITLGSCNQTNEVVEPQAPRVQLTVSNLPRIDPGEGHYQVWAYILDFNKPAGGNGVLHGDYYSMGEFNIAPDGSGPVDLEDNPVRFTVPEGKDVQLVQDVMIAFQGPEEGLARVQHDEPGPPLLIGHLMGDETRGTADLSLTDVFGNGLGTATGRYTLAAPTSVPSDSNAGVWFVELGTPVTAGLHLPVLPAGWMYEGWAVEHQGELETRILSTGKFLSPDSADADGAGASKGPGTGYPFPGQDFIVVPQGKPDLEAFEIRLTIEPDPDNSPEPFGLTLMTSRVLVHVDRPPATTSGTRSLANMMQPSVAPRATLTVVK